MFMRIILMILVVAIGFGGYMAAAHAFGSVPCNSVMEQVINENTLPNDIMDISKCLEYQVEKDQPKNADNDKSSHKTSCLDCSHCCASHAAGLINVGLILDFPSQKLNPPKDQILAGEYLFSLLRPPKSLV
jgi:hypothetical protein